MLAVALAEEGLGWPADEPFVLLGHSRGGSLTIATRAGPPLRPAPRAGLHWIAHRVSIAPRMTVDGQSVRNYSNRVMMATAE